MSNFTSLFSGDSPIPDPPHLKYIGLVVSCLLSFFLLFVILFVTFEFSMDMFGDFFGFETVRGTKETPVLENVPKNALVTEPEITSPQSLASRFKVLSPLPESFFSQNEIAILCTWNPPKRNFRVLPFAVLDLKVDGNFYSWDEQFGNNTWLSHLELKPGRHRIQSQVFDVEFFIEDSESPAPPTWKRFSMHPFIDDPKECASCHDLFDESDVIVRKGHHLRIGAWKGNESCLTCHHDEEFEMRHLMIAAPETDCSSCHVVHGTVNSGKLLKEVGDVSSP